MRTFKFELSEDMITVISRALAAQPYHLVHATIAEMNRQVEEQVQPIPIRDREA